MFCGHCSCLAQGVIPDKPDMIRVSVNHLTNGVDIEWEPSDDPDIEFYHIYRMDGTTGEKLFTLTGSTYRYTHESADLEFLSYTVTAEDSSGNESLLEDNRHRAVALGVESEACEPANILTWTPYEGWDTKLAGYIIYGGTSSDDTDSLDWVNRDVLSYVHHNVDYDSVYYYHIKAVNVIDTVSYSPKISHTVGIPDAPAYLRVDYVSVVDGQTVELKFSADPESSIRDFRILKRTDRDSPYSETALVRDLSPESYTYTDHSSTTRDSYSYKVEAIYNPGGCSSSLVLAESNPGSTILLSGHLDGDRIMLEWTPYEEFQNGNSGYQVQRMSGDGEFIDLGSTPPDANSWVDPVSGLDAASQSGKLQYRVRALGMQIPGADPGVSLSNIATVTLASAMVLPNAIIPGDPVNGIFAPVFDFIPRDYSMIIFDRGGRKIFESSDPGTGWDGSNGQGNFAMEGVYVYYVRYTDHTGRFETLSGNLTVIYPGQQ